MLLYMRGYVLKSSRSFDCSLYTIHSTVSSHLASEICILALGTKMQQLAVLLSLQHLLVLCNALRAFVLYSMISPISLSHE